MNGGGDSKCDSESQAFHLQVPSGLGRLNSSGSTCLSAVVGLHEQPAANPTEPLNAFFEKRSLASGKDKESLYPCKNFDRVPIRVDPDGLSTGITKDASVLQNDDRERIILSKVLSIGRRATGLRKVS